MRIEDTRVAVDADLAAGKITRAAHDNVLAVAEFCSRQDAYQMVDHFGPAEPVITPVGDAQHGCLGPLGVVFTSNRTGWWTRLQDLAAVADIPEAALAEEWKRQREDPNTPVDSIEWTTEDGEKILYRLFSAVAALVATVRLAPQHEEFRARLSPELRHQLEVFGY
jgi:hypothetical protein